jgi:hypothetical protein
MVSTSAWRQASAFFKHKGDDIGNITDLGVAG